jgi:hypothetical protein
MSQESTAHSPGRFVMDGRAASITLDRSQFILAEYTALRAEIVKHIEVQYQLVGFNLLAFGVALSIAVQSRSSVPASLYPIVALFLAFCWISATLEIQRCGEYIREEIEKPYTDGEGWESHLVKYQERPWWRWGTRGMRGSFITTSSIATTTSITISKWQTIDTILASSGAIALIACTAVLTIRRLPYAGPHSHRNPTLDTTQEAAQKPA